MKYQYEVQTYLTTKDKWVALDLFETYDEACEFYLGRYDAMVEGNNEDLYDDSHICYKVLKENYRIVDLEAE